MVSPFYKGEKFAAINGGFCLSKSAKMEYQPMPSSRTKAFYKRCRFDSFAATTEAIAKYKARKAQTKRA